MRTEKHHIIKRKTELKYSYLHSQHQMDYHQMEILGPNLLDLVHHHHPHQILYNFHDQAEIFIISDHSSNKITRQSHTTQVDRDTTEISFTSESNPFHLKGLK